jgi:DNA-binding FadR family transcriptional regulator
MDSRTNRAAGGTEDGAPAIPRLDAVQLPKAAELVAGALRRKIIRHELRVSDALPSESQLMAEMNVARTTVREALRILESEGLVDVRRGAGGGARVRLPAVPMVAKYIGLLLQYEGATVQDVYRARLQLEAPAAGMLAETSSPEIVAQLRAALAEEVASADDPAASSRAHGRFHARVIQLTGSQTYAVLSAVTNRIIQVQADRFFVAGGERAQPGLAKAHRAHERLVELIVAGAAQDAEELWRRHIEASDAYILSAPGAQSVLDLLQ